MKPPFAESQDPIDVDIDGPAPPAQSPEPVPSKEHDTSLSKSEKVVEGQSASDPADAALESQSSRPQKNAQAVEVTRPATSEGQHVKPRRFTPGFPKDVVYPFHRDFQRARSFFERRASQIRKRLSRISRRSSGARLASSKKADDSSILQTPI